ncbi:hypothetical protein PR048_011568 [Dryococelus australis]|uniref:HAT C-terminal dimerisation domain-containing protein n=1 Tax=Dryococelus australis TaxID=614101 RepID=A0ABQ9HLZ2_9NEOP|nr:hypothetical protein PR048_011568 [Dryococelus australis]
MACAKSGVKSRMYAEQPLALYIHCAAHALDLALQDSSKSIPLIRNCLQCVNYNGEIVRDSPKRHVEFSQIEIDHNLTNSGPQSLCPTRWTVREASLSGLLYQLSQGNVLFGIKITQMVFSLTENLSTTLQCKTQTVAGAKEAVSVVEQKIKEIDPSKPIQPRMRILPKRLEQAQNPAAVHMSESVKQYNRKMYYEFLDNIINEIENRSEQPEFEKYLYLEKSLPLAPVSLAKLTLTTISAFGIDVAKLKHEMEFITQLIQTPKNVEDYVNDVLRRLVLGFPATSSKAEQSFSMLHRIKTYLRSTVTRKHFNHLCVITSYPMT